MGPILGSGSIILEFALVVHDSIVTLYSSTLFGPETVVHHFGWCAAGSIIALKNFKVISPLLFQKEKYSGKCVR